MEPKNRKTKNCVVFVTHRLDKGVRRYLHYIREVAEGIMDLVVLYDCATNPLDEGLLAKEDIFVFDSSKLPGFFHCHNHKLPNPLVALFELARQRKYDHYLLMENDLVLNGDLRTFFQKMNVLDSVDYIHIASDSEGDPLSHYPQQYIRDNPFENLYFSWCQLFMVSMRYLDGLEQFIKTNSSFYYEFLLPTLAFNRNYVVRQFENFGYRFEVSWGPADICEAKYLHDRQRDTFYHPIKNSLIIKYSPYEYLAR